MVRVYEQPGIYKPPNAKHTTWIGSIVQGDVMTQMSPSSVPIPMPPYTHLLQTSPKKPMKCPTFPKMLPSVPLVKKRMSNNMNFIKSKYVDMIFNSRNTNFSKTRIDE